MCLICHQVALFENSTQPYTAKAINDCELYWISKDELMMSLDAWPVARQHFAALAKAKMEDIISFR